MSSRIKLNDVLGVPRGIRCGLWISTDVIVFMFWCGCRGGEQFLKETVVLKLNGGLGTSMGLDKAKSLLPVKGDDTFLDLMAKQVR